MQNRPINYFSKFTKLTEEESKALSESMVVKEIKKGDFLIKEGQCAILPKNPASS